VSVLRDYLDYLGDFEEQRSSARRWHRRGHNFPFAFWRLTEPEISRSFKNRVRVVLNVFAAAVSDHVSMANNHLGKVHWR